MTTITSESIPTTTTDTESTNRLWRYLAAFAAGIVLSVSVAAGVTALTNDDDPAPVSTSHASSSSSSSAADQCPMFAGRAC